MAAWRTYAPDGRALEVEHDAGAWVARCGGREAAAPTAAGAIAAAIATDVRAIGRAACSVERWVASQASLLEAEAAAGAGGEPVAAALDLVRRSPADDGLLALIVLRPAEGEREVAGEARLDLDAGVVGDSWRARGSSHTADGSADPAAQVTLVNARAAALFAGSRTRWPLAGDQLYVDFDLAVATLPAGSRLAIGAAVIEISAQPHTGCAKFSARFGSEALRLVNSPVGRGLRLRGANARVVEPGGLRQGDAVRRVP